MGHTVWPRLGAGRRHRASLGRLVNVNLREKLVHLVLVLSGVLLVVQHVDRLVPTLDTGLGVGLHPTLGQLKIGLHIADDVILGEEEQA